MLALVVIGNLANLSLFSARVPGPESLLAGHPLMVVSLVCVQIVVTLVLVGVLARPTAASGGMSLRTYARPATSHPNVPPSAA